jgi:hypothetical protein
MDNKEIIDKLLENPKVLKLVLENFRLENKINIEELTDSEIEQLIIQTINEEKIDFNKLYQLIEKIE